MKATIHCPKCNASFSVPESAFGRSATCSQCQQRFQVQPPGESEGVKDSDGGDGGTRSTTGFPGIETTPKPRAAQPELGAAPGNKKNAKSGGNSLPWIVAGMMSVAAVAAVLYVVFGSGSTGSPGQGQGPSSQGAAQGGMGELVLYLGEAAKESLSLQLDGAEQSLTTEATQRLSLDSGTYQLRLRRRGYEPVEQTLQVAARSAVSVTPEWRKIGATADPIATETHGGAGWVQSVDVAQRRAKMSGEHVLVLFVGSDWSAESRTLVAQTLASSAVGAALQGKFKLAVLDYPLTRESGTQIEDPAHNKWMLEKYGVDPEEFPTLLAMDSEGLPFAEVSAESSAVALADQIQRLHRLKEEYDLTLGGVTDLSAARAAIDWLKAQQVLRHHHKQVLRWYTLAQRQDPDNGKGELGPFFEAMWQAEVVRGLRDQDGQELQRMLRLLDQWREEGKFQDPDRGARLHLLATFAAFQMEDLERARQFAEKGAQFEAKDRELTNKLAQIPKALDEAGQLGSGSGFVIAPNYVLTNYHVVEGPGAIKLGLADGGPASIDARVVASDRGKDLALLVTGQPIGRPLRVAAESPGRGAQVAAFGFPLGGAVGDGLKLTTGVISGLPSPDTDGMLLLDMRVNPGNSGGPLCAPNGEVVGVVTARTLADAEVDSYGMAIPASTIDVFLRKHVPKYTPAARASIGSGWDQVDAAVNESVIRIVKVR